MKIKEVGICRVWCKEDPDSFHLHPDYYEPIKAAWMKGEAFFSGHDLYGDEMVIKLGQVVAISRGTPDAMAEAAAEHKADQIAGGD